MSLCNRRSRNFDFQAFKYISYHFPLKSASSSSLDLEASVESQDAVKALKDRVVQLESALSTAEATRVAAEERARTAEREKERARDRVRRLRERAEKAFAASGLDTVLCISSSGLQPEPYEEPMEERPTKKASRQERGSRLESSTGEEEKSALARLYEDVASLIESHGSQSESDYEALPDGAR